MPLKPTPLPSSETLDQLLRLDRETGFLYWRSRPTEMFSNADAAKAWNARWAGEKALSGISCGYRRGSIQGSSVLAHRVVWKMAHGEEPRVIDHENGDKTDNRPSNLRSVTHGENSRNAKRSAANTSGFSGVVWNKRVGKWQSQIGYRSRNIVLGHYDQFDDAISARLDAERTYGFHPNHGRVQA